jgi:hypothetical protein
VEKVSHLQDGLPFPALPAISRLAGSIGDALLDALLEAGGNVIVTTSSYSQPTTDRFRHKYERHGGGGFFSLQFSARLIFFFQGREAL